MGDKTLKELRKEVNDVLSKIQQANKTKSKLNTSIEGFKARFAKLNKQIEKAKQKERADRAMSDFVNSELVAGEIIDLDDKVRVFEVTCYDVEPWEKPKISHIIDEGDDPSFYCANCEVEHKHIKCDRLRVDSVDLQDEYHIVRLVMMMSINKLLGMT